MRNSRFVYDWLYILDRSAKSEAKALRRMLKVSQYEQIRRRDSKETYVAYQNKEQLGQKRAFTFDRGFSRRSDFRYQASEVHTYPEAHGFSM
jgi:hypothetical protein